MDSRIKVLIVDDEKIIRNFFRQLLSLLGLEIIEAEDGYKAIECSKKDKFDIFFIDMRMPGLNGLDTYREIRKIQPEASVVMMTGYAVEDLLQQAQKEGAYSIIRKPFNINEIKGVLDKVGTGNSGKPLNILVIDDEEIILNFFSGLLKGKNLKYKIARGRDDALLAVKKEKFDLVFLDLVLKDADGLAVYNEIKEIFPQINVVLITGYPQKAAEIKDKIEIAGCLYKPFEVEDILKCIEQVKSRINDTVRG